MLDLKPCPQCGEVPEIGYACGEYFILPISRAVGVLRVQFFSPKCTQPKNKKSKHGIGGLKMANADRCVCCGEIVPEGRGSAQGRR